MPKKAPEPAHFQFRPHHFLCAVGYQGLGYDDAFTANFNKIAETLHGQDGDQTHLQVTFQTDSICSACPHKRGHLCTDQHKIDQLDSGHAAALSLHDGDILTWGDAKHRIATTVTDDIFDKMCDRCEWKKLGVCKDALHVLKKEYGSL